MLDSQKSRFAVKKAPAFFQGMGFPINPVAIHSQTKHSLSVQVWITQNKAHKKQRPAVFLQSGINPQTNLQPTLPPKHTKALPQFVKGLSTIWCPHGDLNPSRRRERAVSWARLDDRDAKPRNRRSQVETFPHPTV